MAQNGPATGGYPRDYSLNPFYKDCATATAPLSASSRTPNQKVFQDELALATAQIDLE
jgi:hypothetical protein